MTIKIANEADRITVAAILFKNGYAVSQKKMKLGNKTITYIEATGRED
jgi:hypothetical protein